MAKRGIVERWAVFWPLLGLCLLAGSRWLLEAAHPEVQSSAGTQAAGCWIAAGVSLAWGQRQRPAARLRSEIELRRPSGASLTTRLTDALGASAAGAMAIAGSALAAAISPKTVHSGDATIALALTPCVVAVAVEASSSAGSQEMTRRLWPGLAGVAGLLLLLPQPHVGSWRLGVALAAMPLFAGAGATLYLQRTGTSGVGNWRSFGSLHASAVLALAGLVYVLLASRDPITARAAFTWSAAGLDGVMALLTLVTLGRLGPVRWAAQFLLAPLLTLTEGVVFLRPLLDLRSWLAFLLLAVSGVYLLVVGRTAPNQPSWQTSAET